MKIFKANKGNFWVYILIAFLFPLLIFFIFNEDELLPLIILFGLFIPFFLFTWIFFSTYYKIDASYLYYQSGFIKGKIQIQQIKEIQVNKTLWSGLKPAMATKGLIIKYGYDEIYIAPERNQDLVQNLIQINPSITIK